MGGLSVFHTKETLFPCFFLSFMWDTMFFRSSLYPVHRQKASKSALLEVFKQIQKNLPSSKQLQVCRPLKAYRSAHPMLWGGTSVVHNCLLPNP